jgi:hypothetical protein
MMQASSQQRLSAFVASLFISMQLQHYVTNASHCCALGSAFSLWLHNTGWARSGMQQQHQHV